MTTGISPYETPAPIMDRDPSLDTLDITLTVAQEPVNIGGGITANAETIDGAIPAPTLRLNVDDTLIVRLVNDLPYPSGIHWHGIELQNAADGTPVTQDGVAVGPFTPPSPASPTGGTYLYKFKVPRPGLFWYHPHHFHSTNRVFRGTYGMIVVTEPAVETPLISGGVIPGPADTEQLVLSDITVCKAPGMNDATTYIDPTTLPAADRPEWLSGATSQLGPTPVGLCEIAPAGQALQEDGSPATVSYGSGDVPNIQRSGGGRTVEGQIVLTNGVNVGGRNGTPAAPGALAAGAETRSVLAGQGLRLQIVNCAHLRYFRLRLTTSSGVQVPLVRIGGEGSLLDNAVEEGGVIGGAGGFDTGYDAGEILLPPSSRADVVAAIPPGEPVGSVLTLWTRDFQRVGPANPGGWAQLPTVPVMHLEVTGTAPGTPYTIVGGRVGGPIGTALRDAVPGVDNVEALPAPAPGTGLLNPSTFSPPKTGWLTDIENIQLTASGGVAGVNGVHGEFMASPYTSNLHIDSSRYAEQGVTLELMVSNMSGAHHPFHLHGFSFQPISLNVGGSPVFTWPYSEFVDVVNIPAGHSLTFRVRLDDRELADGVTMGGALGRWLFHCHIFFHAHNGMLSELVVTTNDGSEKPNIDVRGSWAYAPIGGTATRTGTFFHPDGQLMTLTASKGTVVPAGSSAGGEWSWSYTSALGDAPSIEYVYITAEDTDGLKDQTVFRLKIGEPDDGSDNGDPHIHTVDGKRYDFQAVGEFILLRDREEGMEVQTRQTPVLTQNPITDPYSGLTACVSVNTAVAARVGSHRIAYQPGEDGEGLQFYLDGRPAQLPTEGMNLDGHYVSVLDVNGTAGLRVDYAHHTVLTVSPHFWNSHNIWYMNVSVTHTQGDEGVMGPIPDSSWLPALPNGKTVGPMPQSLHERYVTLYQTFANAWRVTADSSLFVYGPDESTATFTDRDWPAEERPCELKPGFELPGAPVLAGMPVAEAEQICQGVTIDGLFQDCVFDVATTGDETFAEGYLFAQALRLHGSAVKLAGTDACLLPDGRPGILATVLPLGRGQPTPTGFVKFLVEGVEVGSAIKLDDMGRACLPAERLEPGEHDVQAVYTGSDGEYTYRPSTSPILQYTVEKRVDPGGGVDFKKRPIWMWVLFFIILIVVIILSILLGIPL